MRRTIMIAAVLALTAVTWPAQAQVVGGNCAIKWNANAEADLASYRVYGTLTPAGGVAVSKTIDVLKPAVSTTCAALGLQTGGTLSIQLDAVDILGNRSAKTAAVIVTQDIVGPTQPTGLTVTPNP